MEEILDPHLQDVFRERPQDHFEQPSIAVIEGGDGQPLAAESVMQPTVLPSVDIACEWPSVVADLSSKRAAVARLHGVHTDEGDSTVKLALDPYEAGSLAAARRAEITGGDPARNAAMARRVLDGAKDGTRTAVLLNAGAACYVGGLARSVRDGMALAAAAIDKGAAGAVLERFVATSQRLGTLEATPA